MLVASSVSSPTSTPAVSSAAYSSFPSEVDRGETPDGLRACETVAAAVSNASPLSTATKEFEHVILIDQVCMCC